jgi:hypothetical protein
VYHDPEQLMRAIPVELCGLLRVNAVALVSCSEMEAVSWFAVDGKRDAIPATPSRLLKKLHFACLILV